MLTQLDVAYPHRLSRICYVIECDERNQLFNSRNSFMYIHQHSISVVDAQTEFRHCERGGLELESPRKKYLCTTSIITNKTELCNSQTSLFGGGCSTSPTPTPSLSRIPSQYSPAVLGIQTHLAVPYLPGRLEIPQVQPQYLSQLTSHKMT